MVNEIARLAFGTGCEVAQLAQWMHIIKGFERREAAAVVLKCGYRMVESTLLGQLQAKLGQGAHHARPNCHAGHNDDEFVPAVGGVQAVQSAQVDQSLSGAGFHLDADIERPTLRWRAELKPFWADALALRNLLHVVLQLGPAQGAAVARPVLRLRFGRAAKDANHRLDGVVLVCQGFQAEVLLCHGCARGQQVE